MAWVSKSRVTEAQRKAEAAAARRTQAAAAVRAAQADSEDDDEDEGMPSAAELAGAKVKHTAEELGEGETMILTLGELAGPGWGCFGVLGGGAGMSNRRRSWRGGVGWGGVDERRPPAGLSPALRRASP